MPTHPSYSTQAPFQFCHTVNDLVKLEGHAIKNEESLE